MVSAEVDPAVAWLQGFLHAFAWFNNNTDHGYTFTLDVLPKPSSLRDAVVHHFAGDVERLELTPVPEWSGAVREVLTEWLFAFRAPADTPTEEYFRLQDPHRSFSLSDEGFRDMLLNEVLGRFETVVRPTEVWKVQVDTRQWYECYYNDLAFEEDGRVLYLHCGVSD